LGAQRRDASRIYLNHHRIFTRDGGRWGIGQVHRILTRPTYVGRHEFNKRAKNKTLKPISEIVTVDVPPRHRLWRGDG
jgi:site-specific DNA recombinase